MKLSVLVGNVFDGFDHIAFLLHNMAAQTTRAFELVLVDEFYQSNYIRVRDLGALFGLKIVHTPPCEMYHAGARMHWELHNNELLFASGEWVLHHGVFRYLHMAAVETVISNAEQNICTVFAQNPGGTLGDIYACNVETRYDLSMESVDYPHLSQSGFFSIRRDDMIHLLNGHNEALTLPHWVDNDLSQRARRLPLKVTVVQKGLLRLEKSTRYGQKELCTNPPLELHYPFYAVRTASGMGMPTCDWDINPKCLNFCLYTPFVEERKIDKSIRRFIHNDYEWLQCPVCKTLCVEDPESYMGHLDSHTNKRAPVNLGGIGRNLGRVDEDLRGRPLTEKIAIMKYSHVNPRYLQEN